MKDSTTSQEDEESEDEGLEEVCAFDLCGKLKALYAGLALLLLKLRVMRSFTQFVKDRKCLCDYSVEIYK